LAFGLEPPSPPPKKLRMSTGMMGRRRICAMKNPPELRVVRNQKKRKEKEMALQVEIKSP